MQHDTSPHKVEVGERKRLLQCASLWLCYSRMLFAQCYPTFNRFYCKVFLTEAFKEFGGAADRCMVDNTSVVIASGTGPERGGGAGDGGLCRALRLQLRRPRAR